MLAQLKCNVGLDDISDERDINMSLTFWLYMRVIITSSNVIV